MRYLERGNGIDQIMYDLLYHLSCLRRLELSGPSSVAVVFFPSEGEVVHKSNSSICSSRIICTPHVVSRTTSVPCLFACRDKVVTDTLLTVLLIFEFALNTHNEEKCSSVFREFCAQSKDSTKAAEQCLETLKSGLQDCGSPWHNQDHVAVKSPSASLKSLNTSENNNNSNSSRRFWRFSGDSNMVRPYKAPDEENRQATMMAALQSTSFLQKQLAYVLSGAEEHTLSHVSLFQLDPLGQGFSLAEINNRTTSNILGLVRHEDPSLVSMTFVLLDNLLTKRKRLITSLVQTYIIDDPNLMIIFDRAKVLVAQAISHYGCAQLLCLLDAKG